MKAQIINPCSTLGEQSETVGEAETEDDHNEANL